MKFIVLVLALLLTGQIAGHIGDAQAKGPADKATGYVLGAPAEHPLWWHSFNFTAHEMGDALAGKGFVRHFRLDVDGVTPIREEFCPIIYVVAFENEAWFSGPIIYDSAHSDPTRWMVFHVLDGGQPGRGNDLLQWQRVADESAALDYLDGLEADYKDYVIVEGNIQVHTK
ncbi:MAG: hypothetical protein HKN57_08195 [Xanthomonadales bacterium]|nr:hypothetical protein [Gammaproteobacteria bacterium]NND57219.1 hypothetical protein [Xanthomonadales bacterium]